MYRGQAEGLDKSEAISIKRETCDADVVQRRRMGGVIGRENERKKKKKKKALCEVRRKIQEEEGKRETKYDRLDRILESIMHTSCSKEVQDAKCSDQSRKGMRQRGSGGFRYLTGR